MTLGEIWGFVNDGYFTAADFDSEGNQIAGPDQSWVMNNNANKWEPGDIKFKDLNDDGKIDWGIPRLATPEIARSSETAFLATPTASI